MDNQELVEVYQKIVIGKFGSVSKRHNSNYFYKTGNSAIWDEVMEKTAFLPEAYSILYRIYGLSINLKQLNPCKKCGCNTGRITGKSKHDINYSEYCSDVCQKHR